MKYGKDLAVNFSRYVSNLITKSGFDTGLDEPQKEARAQTKAEETLQEQLAIHQQREQEQKERELKDKDTPPSPTPSFGPSRRPGRR